MAAASDENPAPVAAGHGADRSCEVQPADNRSDERPRQVTLPLLIAEWPKDSRGNTFRVHLGEYAGRYTIDLRLWYADGDGGLKPTRTGLTTAVKHLPQLADALAKAREVAGIIGMIPPDDGRADGT